MGFLGSYGKAIDPLGVMGGSGWFGGGDEEQAPSLREIFQEYPGIINDLMGLSQDMAPQQAQLQLDMQKEFMPQLLQSQQDALSSVSPYGAGLGELLAQQATEGMSGDLTDSERRAFMDVQKSLVGGQSTSGLGTDYIGRNMLDFIQGRKSQNQQLGLQARSLLPQLSLQQPSYVDYSQQFSPSQFMGGAQQQQQMDYNMNAGGGDMFSQLLPIIGGLAGNMIAPGVGGMVGSQVGSMAGGQDISSLLNQKYGNTPLSYSSSGLGGNFYGG